MANRSDYPQTDETLKGLLTIAVEHRDVASLDYLGIRISSDEWYGMLEQAKQASREHLIDSQSVFSSLLWEHIEKQTKSNG